MDLASLETPCLVLDKGKVARNIKRLDRRMAKLGAAMRPHGKTAKNIDIMRPALAGQPGGITVSTLKEAEYYFENGINDIVYAVGIAPVKLPRVIRLIREGADIAVLLDSVAQAGFVADKARQHGVTIPALIEIDSDGHRAGVAPGDPLLVEIGRLLNESEHVVLRGVLTHAGGSYDCKTGDEIRAMAEQERAMAVKCAGQLRENGLPCPVVSVGSTPTSHFARDLSGVSEVRAGVYIFHDLVMAGLGVCDLNDIALSVLTAVIGHQREKGWVIIDAGFTALSKDRGTASQAVDQGYGLVCDLNGEPCTDLIVAVTNQEHGIIQARGGEPLDVQRFPVGSMVRILPNHACATAGMHERYYVVDGATAVTDVWERVNGW